MKKKSPSLSGGARPRRICIVATIPMPLNVFMAPHIRALSRTYPITLVANGRSEEVGSLLSDKVRFSPIGIERKISLLNDLAVFFDLWRLFRRERFDCVHSLMPKAGLLAMLAAKFAGVPLRIHAFTGQVWATQQGSVRLLLKSLDQLLAACATHLLADSHSQRDFLLAEGVTRSDKLSVLAQGSACGVDPARFFSDSVRREAVRIKHGIPMKATVALYLGRLNRDKGIPELAAAFAKASAQCKELHLFVVGPDEENMKALMMSVVGDAASRLHFSGFSSEPEACMAAADFFVLPSHREGFGSTVLEAAACGIPSIGSCIYGLTDAIIDGQTGLLVPVGDVEALAGAMGRLSRDVDFRLRLGQQALIRAVRDFQTKLLTDALEGYYEKILSNSDF
jgi:glycosyltransferase involved in cell wall biosynthesis